MSRGIGSTNRDWALLAKEFVKDGWSLKKRGDIYKFLQEHLISIGTNTYPFLREAVHKELELNK